MPKNIVVLSDGTGQEGGRGHDTNIYKLFRMLEDRTDRQIVFYDEGLGTDWRKFTGNAFGAGFSNNLLQGYRFIFDNYQSGDRLYLLGFSRGAATVRSLASFIHYFGILPASRPELIEQAYKLYERGQDKMGSNLMKRALARTDDEDDWDILNKQAADFVNEHPNQWANIEFMGVWDTVPALGLVALAGLNTYLGKIFGFNFHNFHLHPRVRNAYHALSIDDDRLWFHPSLWREKSREEQIVEQVWFSGAHTDVGGGFKESGLSDIAFEWMVEKAVNHGLRLYLRSRKYWNFVIAPDATDRYHPPRSGFGKIFKEGKRDEVWFKQGEEMGEEVTAYAGFGAPVIHKSVLERHKRNTGGNEQENDRNPWILRRTYKSSNRGFEDFLRHRFYESLKFEWKKYDWEKECHQAQTFEEWIQGSKYKKYYGSYDWDLYKVHSEDGYKEHCITSWEQKQDPEGRNAWLKKHLYKNEKQLNPDWIVKFSPYTRWLEEHTEEHEGETYYVEPIRRLEEMNVPLAFRDYDEDSLEALLKNNEPEKINAEHFNLLRRADEEKRGFNRIRYDLQRWSGRDEEYNKLFSRKKQKTSRTKRTTKARK